MSLANMASTVDLSNWTALELEKLIKCVEKKRYLYNSTLPEYNKSTLIEKTWDSIAREIGGVKNGVKCRQTWGHLRNLYRRYLYSHKEGKKSYPWMHNMRFMKPFITGITSNTSKMKQRLFLNSSKEPLDCINDETVHNFQMDSTDSSPSSPSSESINLSISDSGGPSSQYTELSSQRTEMSSQRTEPSSQQSQTDLSQTFHPLLLPQMPDTPVRSEEDTVVPESASPSSSGRSKSKGTTTFCLTSDSEDESSNQGVTHAFTTYLNLVPHNDEEFPHSHFLKDVATDLLLLNPRQVLQFKMGLRQLFMDIMYPSA